MEKRTVVDLGLVGAHWLTRGRSLVWECRVAVGQGWRGLGFQQGRVHNLEMPPFVK